MVALDLLGRRAALRILWELRGEPLTFRALLEAVDTNPSLLNTRLNELREAGLIDHMGQGYCLTEAGGGVTNGVTASTRLGGDLVQVIPDWHRLIRGSSLTASSIQLIRSSHGCDFLMTDPDRTLNARS